MDMITCRACGAQFPDTEAACPQCGLQAPRAAAGKEASKSGRAVRLKQLLVLVLGCLAWAIGIIRQFSFGGSPIGSLLFLSILQYTAMYGAMIFFHLLEKKTPAKILVLIGFSCTVLYPIVQPLIYSGLYGTSPERFLSLKFFLSHLVNISMGVLLMVYIMTGRKGKNGIAWLIIYAHLFLFQQIISFNTDLFAIIHMFHILLFFAVGYSPDKWYGGRQAAPAAPAPEARASGDDA